MRHRENAVLSFSVGTQFHSPFENGRFGSGFEVISVGSEAEARSEIENGSMRRFLDLHRNRAIPPLPAKLPDGRITFVKSDTSGAAPKAVIT